MPSFNSSTILGNLTRDVELRYIGNGTAVCDITVAVNDRVKRGDQWVDECSFIDCTLFGRTAEVCNEYCNKGSCILISGRLRQETWEKDGQKRSKLKLIGDKLQMLDRRQESEHKHRTRNEKPSDDDRQSSQDDSQDIPDDEIPF